MGPFYQCGEGGQGQVLDFHSVTYGGAVQDTLGKHLKGPLLPLPRGGKLDAVTQWPEVYWEKHSLHPAQQSLCLRPWPRYLRWWQCGVQPHIEHYLVQFLGRSTVICHKSPGFFFFTCHTMLVRALWAGHTVPTWGSSCIVSPISFCTPRQLILFNNYPFSWGRQPYGFPVGIFPQRCFESCNLEAEFTNRSLQTLTLQDISVHHIFWYWREKQNKQKILTFCGGRMSICRVQRIFLVITVCPP